MSLLANNISMRNFRKKLLLKGSEYNNKQLNRVLMFTLVMGGKKGLNSCY